MPASGLERQVMGRRRQQAIQKREVQVWIAGVCMLVGICTTVCVVRCEGYLLRKYCNQIGGNGRRHKGLQEQRQLVS